MKAGGQLLACEAGREVPHLTRELHNGGLHKGDANAMQEELAAEPM